MNFVSCRRFLLDQKWKNSLTSLKAPILDVGGVKYNRRGAFQVPLDLMDQWITVNNDLATRPDIQAQLPDIPVNSASFNTVILTEVLEYVDDYKKLLTEIHRVLSSDGRLILSTPFLSPLHGDKYVDKLRFTEYYLKEILSPSFDIITFERMGGFLSVALDCWRSENFIKKKSIFFQLHVSMFKVFALLALKIEPLLFKNNEFSSTGFWIIAKKKT